MSVLEPQDEDSNKTSSIPRSKYLEKENFTAQLYVIQLCLSNILNLLLFAKKKKQEMLIFVGPEVLLCHNLTPARLMVYFFFICVRIGFGISSSLFDISSVNTTATFFVTSLSNLG